MVAVNIRCSIICTANVAPCFHGRMRASWLDRIQACSCGSCALCLHSCSELGAHGIRVNCVSPFAVATPHMCRYFNKGVDEVEAIGMSMANMKGIALKANHIAEAALFLASDESVYVSGHDLVVDGGFSVVYRSPLPSD